MNFMPLVAWARSASYDVVGVLLPGFIFCVLLLSVPIPIVVHSTPLDSFIAQASNTLANFQGSFLLVFVLSYITGFFLKALGDLITQNQHLNACFLRRYFVLGPKLVLLNYNHKNEHLYQLAVNRLNHYFSDQPVPAGKPEDNTNGNSSTENNPNKKSWGAFYHLSNALLDISQFPTRIKTYQNRYELFKSLSVCFFLLALLSLLMLIVTIPAPWAGALQWLPSVLVFFGFAMLSRNLYVKYWQHLGDALIVSTYLVLSDKEKESAELATLHTGDRSDNPA